MEAGYSVPDVCRGHGASYLCLSAWSDSAAFFGCRKRSRRFAAGEKKVEFFYSVGFIDVREGFTYVSDQKVVVYDPEGEPPLVTIDYGDIQGLEFDA